MCFHLFVQSHRKVVGSSYRLAVFSKGVEDGNIFVWEEKCERQAGSGMACWCIASSYHIFTLKKSPAFFIENGPKNFHR